MAVIKIPKSPTGRERRKRVLTFHGRRGRIFRPMTPADFESIDPARIEEAMRNQGKPVKFRMGEGNGARYVTIMHNPTAGMQPNLLIYTTRRSEP